MAIRNGFLFKCIQAGTSGTTEPNWIDCGVGSTLNDGTCIWLNCGSALVIYSGGQTIDSLQPAEAGADVTGNNTSADTAKVNGVASATISPIADLMPAQVGANVTQNFMPSGDNILTNPGFESNVVGTSDGVLLSAGQNISDGWTVGVLTTGMQVYWYSGAGNNSPYGCLLRAGIGMQMPANSGVGTGTALALSSPMNVAPGDTITFGGDCAIGNSDGSNTWTLWGRFSLMAMINGTLTEVALNNLTAAQSYIPCGPFSYVIPSGCSSIQLALHAFVGNPTANAQTVGSTGVLCEYDNLWVTRNDARQPNSAKAYINASDTTTGGHQGFTSYTSIVGIAGMVVEGDNLLDGDSVTFPVAFSSAPIILFGDGGLTYNPAWSTVAQYQNFSATLTPAGGPYTGFTASLQLCQAGSSSSAQTVDFSGENATLSVPSGDTIVNGSLTVNGSMTNTSPEPNTFTVTITDSSHSTVLATFDIGVPARSSMPYSKIVTDAAAVNGTVIQVTPAGATTVNYSTYFAAASTSATPTGVPGVSWAAIATS